MEGYLARGTAWEKRKICSVCTRIKDVSEMVALLTRNYLIHFERKKGLPDGHLPFFTLIKMSRKQVMTLARFQVQQQQRI